MFNSVFSWFKSLFVIQNANSYKYLTILPNHIDEIVLFDSETSSYEPRASWANLGIQKFDQNLTSDNFFIRTPIGSIPIALNRIAKIKQILRKEEERLAIPRSY